jgi:glycosyltransferase involved in cell wall biosynthesis
VLKRAVVFVLKGYPRLSESFIAQEIQALEARGLDLRIVSLRHPTDPAVHPVHREIRAAVSYLPEYLHQEPWRVLRAAWRTLRGARARQVLSLWWRDLRRDPSSSRLRRFGQALVLAAELPPTTVQLHAHFLHTPASVARYAALLSGLPWSVSAHAKDIWTLPEWEKREKLADCRWLVTCTAAGAAHLRNLTPDPKRVALLYHGLDLRRFDSPPEPPPAAAGPLRLLSVGRAVPKKGLDDLLAALARLPPDLDWRLVHVGGGEALASLRRDAERLGIAQRVQWLGPQPQEQVIEQYRCADLFVLPCRVAADGDRDGLPNVLMEAQSQRLACVSTRLSGVPELILDGVTGLLVEPRDVAALSAAIGRLLADPELRQRLAEAGYRRVRGQFRMDAGISELVTRFAAVIG